MKIKNQKRDIQQHKLNPRRIFASKAFLMKTAIKTTTILLVSLLFSLDVFSQDCFTTAVRVGTECGTKVTNKTTDCGDYINKIGCCHTCTGDMIEVVDLETYLQGVLPYEWRQCWGDETGGMNALEAGAIAARSYSMTRIKTLEKKHVKEKYDICNNTCCQVYNGETTYTTTNNAIANTTGMVLVNTNNTIQEAEFSAELNKEGSCKDGQKGNGTLAWPCSDDKVCTGQSNDGHGRGMCQNGSARWAIGKNFENNAGCTYTTQIGYPTKDRNAILLHYYPNWTVVTCRGSVPVNDNCDDKVVNLDVITNICTNTLGTVKGATTSGVMASCDCSPNTVTEFKDVWYKFQIPTSGDNNVIITVTPDAGFDAVVSLYSMNAQGTCNEPITCENKKAFGGTEEMYRELALNTYYFVRVYGYGSGTGFNICVKTGKLLTLPVAEKLTITPSGPTTFCTGGSVTLTASVTGGATSYKWYNSDAPIPGATELSYTATATGSYTVGGTNGSVCLRTSDITSVTVNPNVVAGTVSGTSPLCLNQTATYTAINATAGGSWSIVPGTGDATVGTNGLVTPSVAGNCDVKYTVNSGCGSPVSAYKTLTINPLPTPTITAGGSLCPGVVLSTGIYSSYSWSPGGQTTQSITASAAGNYSVTVTNTNGCNGSSSPTTVNPNPTISGILSTCVNSSTQLTGSPIQHATTPWVSSLTGIATVSNTGLVTGVSAGVSPAHSDITYMNTNGCTKTETVTIFPLPTISGTLTVCKGLTTQLTGSGTPHPTIPWTSSNTGIATVSNTGVVTGIAEGQSTITYIDINGCAKKASVTVNPNPTASTNLASGCQNIPVQIGGSPNTGSGGTGLLNYTWSSVPVGFSSNFEKPSVNPSATTTYSVEVKDANNCIATSSVTIKPNPGEVIVSNSGSQCGGNRYLYPNGGTGGTIYWQGTASEGMNTSESIIPPAGKLVSATGVYYFRARNDAADNLCWGTKGSGDVTINTAPGTPEISIKTKNSNCSTTLTCSAIGASYDWLKDGAQISHSLQDYTTSNNGNYSVNVQNSSGCWSSYSSTINLPNLKIDKEPQDASGSIGSVPPELTPWSEPNILINSNCMGIFCFDFFFRKKGTTNWTPGNLNQCYSTEYDMINAMFIIFVEKDIMEYYVTFRQCGATVTSRVFTVSPTNPPPPTCDYILETYDSYGDAWNGGGHITFYINGSGTNYSGATCSQKCVTFECPPSCNNNCKTSFTINVQDGASLSMSYTAGSWDCENSYVLKNSLGSILSSGGYPGPPISAGNLWSGTASCASAKTSSLFVPQAQQEEPQVSLLSGITIYPNPTPGSFVVDMTFNEEQAEVMVSVTNILGEVILKHKLNNIKNELYQIDLSKYGAGIYFIQVESDIVSEKRKVVVIR